MAALPESEALLLAVYFEESARHHRQEAEKYRRQARGGGSGGLSANGPRERVVTELEVGEDDDEEDFVEED